MLNFMQRVRLTNCMMRIRRETSTCLQSCCSRSVCLRSSEVYPLKNFHPRCEKQQGEREREREASEEIRANCKVRKLILARVSRRSFSRDPSVERLESTNDFPTTRSVSTKASGSSLRNTSLASTCRCNRGKTTAKVFLREKLL